MSEEHLDEAYNRVLEVSRRQGDVADLPAEQEKRGCPRIRLRSILLKGDAKGRSFVIDVSASGASLCTREPAREGDYLYAHCGDADPVRLSVVGCRFSDFDHVMIVAYYRLSCAFDNESEGKQVLVSLLEQGQENLRLERR